MAGLLRFSRPVNCVMSAVGVGIGGVVGVGSAAWGDLAVPLVLAAAAAASFTARGNALNDIFDRETDRINHPDRPLPSRQLTPATAPAFAALAFLATLGREITKDIEDIRGDVDRLTLPRRIGASRAGLVAGLALALCVTLSFLPLYFGVLRIGYAVLVLPADGMFIYAALHSAANPARSQRVTKYAMIVALAAFLAGAFL